MSYLDTEQQDFVVPEKLTFRKVVSNVASVEGVRKNLSKLKALATDNTPMFEWAKGYNRTMAIEDAMAGLTVGVLLIPTGIAYAGLAAQPPITGLLTAFFPAILYALLGTSRYVRCCDLRRNGRIFGSILTNTRCVYFLAATDKCPWVQRLSAVC